MNATEMIGPFSPLIICWTSLVVTVGVLVVAFFFTNITAFARRLRDGRKKVTVGAPPGEGETA